MLLIKDIYSHFGKIDFYISEPYDIKDMEFEEAKVFIKEKMLIHSIA